MDYTIFVDGSVYPNPNGDGGYAFIIEDSEGKRTIGSGYEPNTTNSRMELLAAIMGLEQVDGMGPGEVRLVSDSQYVIKGIQIWRHNWIKTDWEGIKNPDLWRRLSDLVDRFGVRAEWVRGHNKHAQNEQCDELAGQARKNKKGVFHASI